MLPDGAPSSAPVASLLSASEPPADASIAPFEPALGAADEEVADDPDGVAVRVHLIVDAPVAGIGLGRRSASAAFWIASRAAPSSVTASASAPSPLSALISVRKPPTRCPSHGSTSSS